MIIASYKSPACDVMDYFQGFKTQITPVYVCEHRVSLSVIIKLRGVSTKIYCKRYIDVKKNTSLAVVLG